MCQQVFLPFGTITFARIFLVLPAFKESFLPLRIFTREGFS